MDDFIFNSAQHEYRVNGLKYPSVTEILSLAGYTLDFSAIPVAILEQKRDLGTFVHEATEYIDMGAEVPYYPGAEGYVEAYRRFKADFDFMPTEAELQVYHKTLRYAGTIDRVGTINGKLSVIDLKTMVAIDLCAVGPQTAAYTECYFGIKKRYCLQLKSDGSYKLIECKCKEDFQAFMSALNIYNWRKKHGK